MLLFLYRYFRFFFLGLLLLGFICFLLFHEFGIGCLLLEKQSDSHSRAPYTHYIQPKKVIAAAATRTFFLSSTCSRVVTFISLFLFLTVSSNRLGFPFFFCFPFSIFFFFLSSSSSSKKKNNSFEWMNNHIESKEVWKVRPPLWNNTRAAAPPSCRVIRYRPPSSEMEETKTQKNIKRKICCSSGPGRKDDTTDLSPLSLIEDWTKDGDKTVWPPSSRV